MVARRLPLSHSRLSTFLGCRAKFRRRYLDRAPAVVTPSWFGPGRFLHEVFQVYVEERVEAYLGGATETPAPAEREEHARDVVRRLWSGRSPEVRAEVLEEVLAVATRFSGRLPLSPGEVVACELPLAYTYDLRPCEWRGPGVWWRAKVDRLDLVAPDRVRIVDYKTGYTAASDPLQMDLYAAAVAIRNPRIETFLVEVYHVRVDRVDSRELSREEALDVWEEVRGASRLIESLRAESEIDDRERPGSDPFYHWPAMPGGECGYCDVDCPIVGKVAEEWRPVQTREDAERVAAQVIALSKGLRARRDAMRAWAAVNGPIRAGGKLFEHVERPDYLATASEVLDLGRELGLEPADLVSFLRGPGTTEIEAAPIDGPLGELAETIREYYSRPRPDWSERKAPKGD